MDKNCVHVKRACVAMLKRAVRQQRYKLKKKYFDPYPLNLVLKTSPVECMSDLEWLNLVEHWKNEKKMVSLCQRFHFRLALCISYVPNIYTLLL